MIAVQNIAGVGEPLLWARVGFLSAQAVSRGAVCGGNKEVTDYYQYEDSAMAGNFTFYPSAPFSVFVAEKIRLCFHIFNAGTDDL